MAAAHAVRDTVSGPFVLDGAAAHHRWDGFGGLSAGASSRLLRDYPLAQRNDILDLLYKPSHGAGLKICKIEIGGDVMSTDGTEPSHSHYRGDLSCDRGYEVWLAQEALARNPAVVTYGLSWGVPGWVGNGSYFSDDNMHYQAAFCTCFLNKTGRPLDWIGIWNERAWGGADYIVGLRAALDAAGHASTRIMLPDSRFDPAIVQLLVDNATFSTSVGGVGIHSGLTPAPEIDGTGHVYWASETANAPLNLTADWSAAQDWGRLLTRRYIAANITAVISWSTVWSALPGLPYDGRGLMVANTPWSGHYAASAPVWVSAHFGQFLEPGWRHLMTGRGAGVLMGDAGEDLGSYVALVPPAGEGTGGLTLVVETLGKAAVADAVLR